MEMKTLIVFAAVLAATPHAFAEQRELREVVVSARRPLKETGIMKTSFDSTALKENIALSIADVLSYNSSVFVKSYGRATLSTVAFRGTSASHTQVTWNGMPIVNPMLGMTDFSTIPSYFIDRASMLHGSSSLSESSGGLGGLVRLATAPVDPDGLKMQYVQGAGSFSTFDEFLRISYGTEHWRASTRVVYSSSANDYSYINHDKKLNIYDEDKNIIGQYHPREKNRSGAFKDFNALQEVYYRDADNSAGLSAWYTHSDRELPMLTTDYGDEASFDNRQREQSLRAAASWEHFAEKWKSTIRGGYIYSQTAYDYSRDAGGGNMTAMTRARSYVNSLYGHAEGEYTPVRNLNLSISLSARQHFVRSHDKSLSTPAAPESRTIGFNARRAEISAAASAKWRPIEQAGVSVLVRQEVDGGKWTPVMPAVFADAMLWPAINLTARASIARNYRFPSLNDLYFMPGGNPDLRPEHGFSYDAGLEFKTGRQDYYTIGASAGWFDSYIDDWIMWLPTPKGFFSPRNVMSVHAYGIETRADLGIRPAKGWLIDAGASFSWTPSINAGEPVSAADKSPGKQLPYVPKRSASATLRVSHCGWSFLYKWCHYSQRYTMSSNDATLTGHLPPYYMSNIELEKNIDLRFAGLSLKLAVNNLFNEDYLSVLSRPMPGINFEFFVGITPRLGKR